MKKIAIMPVKNEEWILEHSLNCASQFFDHIIVADQNSTDKTPEICKKFNKVVYIKNDSENYNEGNRRQLMLDKAREFTGNNFIINLAADEVFSANIMKSAIFNEMIKDKEPGTGFSFQWVQLWKTDEKYRDDKSVCSNLYRPFAFIDDRITNDEPGFAHLSLIPEAFVKNTVTIDNVKVLHYQFVDFERMLIKQRWARLLEFEHYPQSDFLKSIILNNKYYITKDESGNVYNLITRNDGKRFLRTTSLPGAAQSTSDDTTLSERRLSNSVSQSAGTPLASPKNTVPTANSPAPSVPPCCISPSANPGLRRRWRGIGRGRWRR